MFLGQLFQKHLMQVEGMALIVLGSCSHCAMPSWGCFIPSTEADIKQAKKSKDLEVAVRIATTRERLCWIGAYYAFDAWHVGRGENDGDQQGIARINPVNSPNFGVIHYAIIEKVHECLDAHPTYPTSSSSWSHERAASGIQRDEMRSEACLWRGVCRCAGVGCGCTGTMPFFRWTLCCLALSIQPSIPVLSLFIGFGLEKIDVGWTFDTLLGIAGFHHVWFLKHSETVQDSSILHHLHISTSSTPIFAQDFLTQTSFNIFQCQVLLYASLSLHLSTGPGATSHAPRRARAAAGRQGQPHRGGGESDPPGQETSLVRLRVSALGTLVERCGKWDDGMVWNNGKEMGDQ